MIRRTSLIRTSVLICIVFFLLSGTAWGQHGILVNLGLLEGTEVSKDNIFNYQVINNSGMTRSAKIKGTLHYRNSSLRISYTFNTSLHSGVNTFTPDGAINPIWDFSDNALRELFFTYNKLPQGTYQYCVEIIIDGQNAEAPDGIPIDACTYYTVNDIFLIQLIEPENNAEIYEHYPMFSWLVNYPFAAELTYRIRVAELKKGQNGQAAITRNNPVYQESHLPATGTVYPVTARPLEVFQPYVWAIDAYYKGILLGGSEVWKFTIIEDSILQALSRNPSYIEVNIEKGVTKLYAVGELKLKFIEDEYKTDTLQLSLADKRGQAVKLPDNKWTVQLGDNRRVIPIHEHIKLKHNEDYTLTVTTSKGTSYRILFQYINPQFLR